MKCAFTKCGREVSGSKQFNDIVERIYLCTDHLIQAAALNSYQDGLKFITILEEFDK